MKIVLHKSHSDLVYQGNTGTSGFGATERKIQSEVIDKMIERLRADGHEAVSYSGITIPKTVTGDVFLAPHCNGAVPEARGFSLTIPVQQGSILKKQSESFLLDLINAMKKHTPIPFREHVDDNMKYYYGFEHPMKKMPCAIIEMGFLTNQDDALILKDTQRMANTLYDAVRTFLGYVAPEPTPDFKEWEWAIKNGIIPATTQMSDPMTAIDVAKALYNLNKK